MSTIGELESYLQQLQGEGQLQSQGRFTLDFAKALEKLGSLSRQQVHRWLFFAVQAAVGFRADRIALSVTPRAVSVSFWMERPAEALLDGRAFEAGADDTPALRGIEAACQDLRQALLWGRALNPSSFAMMLEGNHAGYVLSANASGMERRELERKGEGATVCALILVPTGELVAHGVAWAQALQAEAVYRLSFCSVPVELDGKLLSLGESTSLIRNARRRDGNIKLLERYIFDPDPNAPSLAVIHPRRQPASSYFVEGRETVQRQRSWLPVPNAYRLEFSAPGIEAMPWRTLTAAETPAGQLCLGEWSEGPQIERRLWLELDGMELPGFADGRVRTRALLTRLRVKGSYLIICRHGLLLDPLRFEGLPEEGWVVVIASDAVGTDASGLVAVDDDRLEKLRRWSRAEIFGLHQRLAENPPI